MIVIPVAYQLPYKDDPEAFGAYAEPLPLVVEVGFIHPYERALTAWRRQPDGSYREETYRGGRVPVASLPKVVIDFDKLLDG